MYKNSRIETLPICRLFCVMCCWIADMDWGLSMSKSKPQMCLNWGHWSMMKSIVSRHTSHWKHCKFSNPDKIPSLQTKITNVRTVHGVWKSQKKSHSTLRAKRAYVYILSGQKFNQKVPKNGQFWRAFENLKFAVKQCYQTCQF